MSKNKSSSIKQVYLWGGLGNVLYQINLAYYILEKGHKVAINRGLVNYNNILLRNLIKIHFGVYKQSELFIDTSKIEIINKLSFKDLYYFLLFKFGFKVNNFKYFGHDWPSEDEVLINNNFLGYYQKTKYISIQISKSFYSNIIPKSDKLLIDIVKLDSTILIHARFGDKLNTKEFNLSYSNLAKLVDNFTTIVIVTDDLKSSRLIRFNENIKAELIYVSSFDLIDDFYLLSIAKNVIISRSSFSWWATELSVSNQIIHQPFPLYKHVNWTFYSTKKRLDFEA